MSITDIRKCLVASALLLLIGSAAQASTLWVNCGGKGALSSIGAALKVLHSLEPQGPNTINVSGACHENILVQNMDHLTITAVKGASITDTTNGTSDVIDVDHSLSFQLNGFTINGGLDAVSCYYGSYCSLVGNTIQGAADAAVAVYPITSAKIDGGVLQNNTVGLLVRGDVIAGGVLVQGNTGIGVSVSEGGRLLFRKSDDGATQSISQNNQIYGIWAADSATVVCNACTVTGNQLGGVYIDSAEVSFKAYSGPVAITGNANNGVVVADAAAAAFLGPVSVTGNGQIEIVCTGPTSVTRFAIAAAGSAAHTNCIN